MNDQIKKPSPLQVKTEISKEAINQMRLIFNNNKSAKSSTFKSENRFS